MNQWSRRRKRIILSIIVFVVVVVIGAPVFFLFYRAPTCNDLKQNGDETGVDCGGSCQLLCSALSLPLISRGDPRVLEVAPGVYEIVALIENPNTTGEIYRARYTFKLYDAVNAIPLRVVEGETYVPKSTTFAIFEGPFNLEVGIIPIRATLEWEEDTLVFQKNTKPVPQLVITGLNLSRQDTNPRLDASIENASLENVSNIDLVALISNETGSIFAASKTFVDTLPVGAVTPVVFTWPRPFTNQALDINIIIRVFPDRSFIR